MAYAVSKKRTQSIEEVKHKSGLRATTEMIIFENCINLPINYAPNNAYILLPTRVCGVIKIGFKI